MLPRIKDVLLFNVIYEFFLNLLNFSGAYWVGASDIGQQPGHFVWQSDWTKAVDAAFWMSGQPRVFGAGKEACVDVFEGKLRDQECSNTISFVCELDKNDLPCD